MRICLAVHGFPPYERTGVEGYTAALAAELARRGHAVEVFAPRAAPELPHLSQRRERADGYAVTWITSNEGPRDPAEALDPPGIAERFGAFLDRERPEVVHFQHLVKLGVGLVDEARRRGVPTVFTAHDHFAVCHRYTLLRPNLTRCDHLGDAMVCARCDLALSALNRRADELGDYQMGALPEQLDEATREGLRALVDEGDPEGLGLTHDDLDRAFDVRQVLDGRRAQAFAALDRIVCPTEHLAGRLRAGGVPPERLTVLPYGVDVGFAPRVEPRPRAADPEAPLSIGFLSGMAKHKGAHVLLDAFERMEAPARLHVFGGSSDRTYVERMRARADEVGATWHGPYDRAGLPGCLSLVDVVVVPSIWVENQPIVIREAFAAGRPVVAPDLGAFPESVRDGVDGLLYAPDDAADLARTLDRLAREPELGERLAAGIAAVRDVATQADELLVLYAELAPADTSGDDLLPSLRDLAGAYRRLDALPTRALFERCLGGLAALRDGLGVGAAPEGLLLRAFRAGSKVQEDLRDATQASDWLRTTREAEREELEWTREQLADKEESLRAVAEERDWLRGLVDEKESESAWLHGVVEDKDRELAWLHDLKRAHEEELESLRGHVGELVEMGDRLTEHLRSTAEIGLDALETQGHVLGDEVEPLLALLRRAVDEEIEVLDESEHDTKVLDALLGGVRRGLARLHEIERELRWRRDEMARAAEEASRRPTSIVLRRTGLGRRARGWGRDGRGRGGGA